MPVRRSIFFFTLQNDRVLGRKIFYQGGIIISILLYMAVVSSYIYSIVIFLNSNEKINNHTWHKLVHTTNTCFNKNPNLVFQKIYDIWSVRFYFFKIDFEIQIKFGFPTMLPEGHLLFSQQLITKEPNGCSS